MNAMINNGLKNLACGTAALVITVMMSASLMASTAVVHNGALTGSTLRLAKLSVQPGHTWFGQPQPAVLVD
jgi:hypothetical protein